MTTCDDAQSIQVSDLVEKLACDISTLNFDDQSKKKKPKKKSLRKGNRKSTSYELEKTTVQFSTFQHPSISYFPRIPNEFFQNAIEVGLYQDGKIHTELRGTKRGSLVSSLKKNVSLIGNSSLSEAKDYKKEFIGADLYSGFDTFKPMSHETLDSMVPCFNYINQYPGGARNYSNRSKINIISTRHHIVNLAMSIFNSHTSDNTTIICTHLGNGIMTFSEDSSDKSHKMEGIYSQNVNLRKICYSGFALEDLLTVPSESKSYAFSIMESQLTEDICLLLRCEMDAYDPVNNIYSELKCYSKLKLSNSQHRRKLLKTWIQTGIGPLSNIVIGIRNSYDGSLEDIECYSRNSMYRKINNRNLIPSHKDFNFNANIATQWTQFCIQSICKLVIDNLDEGKKDPQSFQIKIDKRHNIHIKKLSVVPSNVVIPHSIL